VLDGVKLGMVRRVVHNKDSPPDAVGEAHEILLNDAVEAGVGASAVIENHKYPCIGFE